MAKIEFASSEEYLADLALQRGVDEPCKECGGLGTKAYGSTSTWHGGVGGQMITSGPCEKCWGSGDEYKKWPSHRAIASARDARLSALEEAARIADEWANSAFGLGKDAVRSSAKEIATAIRALKG